ncbi:hypothetical protein Hanom_Chr03g00253741 [Helianthus anomalus]
MTESLQTHKEFDGLRQLKSITPYVSFLQLFNTQPIMELGRVFTPAPTHRPCCSGILFRFMGCC